MLTIRLRKTETGEERDYTDEYGSREQWEKSGGYIWMEGNFSCDCNRELFFCRAGDEDEPDPITAQCGDTRYRLVWVKDEGGEILYYAGKEAEAGRVPCPACGGRGRTQRMMVGGIALGSDTPNAHEVGGGPCPTCYGTGTISERNQGDTGTPIPNPGEGVDA